MAKKKKALAEQEEDLFYREEEYREEEYREEEYVEEEDGKEAVTKQYDEKEEEYYFSDGDFVDEVQLLEGELDFIGDRQDYDDDASYDDRRAG